MCRARRLDDCRRAPEVTERCDAVEFAAAHGSEQPGTDRRALGMGRNLDRPTR